MDKYLRVEKTRPKVRLMENEIHIASQGMPRSYITYAITLLGERGASKVVLKAMGNAISKAVTVAEIIKRRIPNLHQNTTISSVPITYTLEPLEEGVSPLERVRHVPMITLTLSTTPIDTSSAAYQPPLPADQVKPLLEYEYEGRDSQFVLGRGRAGWTNGNAASQYQNGNGGGPAVQDNNKNNDYGMGSGRYLPPRARGHGRGRYNGNAEYGNGRLNDKGNGGLNDKGKAGNGRSQFVYDGDYSGQDRVGVNDEDGWEVVSRRRGRARRRGGRN